MGYMEVYQLESLRILQDDIKARLGKLAISLDDVTQALRALSELDIDSNKAPLPVLQMRVNLQAAMEQVEWIHDILSEARTIKRVISACRNAQDIHDDERKL